MKRIAGSLLALVMATTAVAEVDLGAYLAGRNAYLANDFATAAPYLARALTAEPDDPMLLETLAAARVALGDFDGAAALAQAMADRGLTSQIAGLAFAVDAAGRGDWEAVLAAPAAGLGVGPAADALGRAWAELGQGKMTEALADFDAMMAGNQIPALALYAKALALASVGDFEGAEAILGLPPDQGLRATPRIIAARAQVLSQLGRNPDALAAIEAAYPGVRDPSLAALHARLSAGETVPWTLVNSAAEGLAEAYFTLATARDPDGDEVSVLFYARAAAALDPTHADAIILAAQMLDRLQQWDLASAAYAQVPPEDPAYLAAELGRAEVLRRAGNREAAVEVLTSLTRAYPALGQVHATLGDTLRVMRQDQEANAAYTRALDLYPQGDGALWYLHYVRGITFFRLDDWPAAEADFRASLALSPDRPQVLNFLGYSLVERGERLDEALGMIERAVALDSQNGAIVDSLGWALFRLGRYAEAVVHMEAAAALLPTDPVINDHLGDVYWAVGRQREARFQWSRALSFGPDADEAQRIARKLEVGLDAVLAAEGAAPLRVAGDQGG